MKTCPACQKSYPDGTAFCLLDGTRLVAALTEADTQLAAGLARHYRVVRRLGKGGMGTVFLAEQIGVGNRLVALKVLNRKFLDDPDFLLRFENEAGSTGRIHHANVVSIYESAQGDDGTPYIAMEFLEGESLREVLLQRGALPLAEVAEILQQSARGLNAAHKLGIIHRDLKPDNIFLTHGDERELIVKVVDFGIAKLRESTVMHTQTGMVLGTPAYMSYEQASGMRSDELDARSDEYSLGVVVYEMLTGRIPFQSDTPVGYLRKHLQEEPPPFKAIAQSLGVPPEVEAVVMKALKKKREERYPSALEFARAFVAAAPPAAALEALPALPSTKVVVSPSPWRQDEKTVASDSYPLADPKLPDHQVVKENRSRVTLVILGLALLVVISGGIGYFYRVTRQLQWAVPGRTPGETKVNSRDGLKYVWIPPGTFQMGCSPGDSECEDSEKPPHQVTITKGLWLGQTEVTVGAYKRFAAATGRQMPDAPSFNSGWVDDSMPIVNVSWNVAHDYCMWAGGRLPTEAEWEYAARGGSNEARYGSLDEVAWYDANSGKRTHPMGEKRANAFGFYDVLGNVYEWVNDWYDEKYYQNSPSQDPSGPLSGHERVFRGGSLISTSGDNRVSTRVRNSPDLWFSSGGFRCGGQPASP